MDFLRKSEGDSKKMDHVTADSWNGSGAPLAVVILDGQGSPYE